ncbi:MAG: rhodanese-like domain-containing protein [Pseudomonadota bacterium]
MQVQFVQNNLWLILIAVVSGGMLFWPMLRSLLMPGDSVGTLEATQLINQKDALLLDVRENHEYAAGHLPNSRHIPLGKLKDRLGEIEKYKQKPVVVYCRSGQRSASACATLRKQGFTQVRNLKGGIMAWEAAGLPVQK